MTLQQLNYVITISETGSLNKAAEVLYVSQPSLTSAVKELEKELGIVIFHRSGRGVSLTNDGVEFISNARQLYYQYESLLEKYGKGGVLKKKFGISTQHYSFAVKSFVETVKKFDMEEYEFTIRETRTREVIEDVSYSKSEIGIIYLSEFNRKIITKLLNTNGLEFHPLVECDTFVYLWKGHPLANRKKISLSLLEDYPCLSFEQGDNGSLYFAEEVFAYREYAKTIKTCDRATMLNLMIGLNGYTLCSGIICEELNGEDYVAVPLDEESESEGKMEIGYILKKDTMLSKTGRLYIKELEQYFNQENKKDD
jgi:DNA-binding transcriptional LysR family regulator